MEVLVKRIVRICVAILSTSFFAFIAVLVALPQPNHSFVFRSIVAAVMGIGLVWGCISTWARVYVCEAAGIRMSGLFPGPRPTDPIELRAWIWQWHFYAAAIVILIGMVAISISIWAHGS
jgi:hypothetical protein